MDQKNYQSLKEKNSLNLEKVMSTLKQSCFTKKVGYLASGKVCTNKEKTQVVLDIEVRQIKTEIKLSTWLEFSKLPRSHFMNGNKKLNQVNEPDHRLVQQIQSIIQESRFTYCYRRVLLALKNLCIIVNHKRVLRLMKKHNLLCTKFTT